MGGARSWGGEEEKRDGSTPPSYAFLYLGMTLILFNSREDLTQTGSSCAHGHTGTKKHKGTAHRDRGRGAGLIHTGDLTRCIHALYWV